MPLFISKQFEITSSLKYNVPQGADLEFEVTLVDVADGPNYDDMPEDERINLG